MTAPGSPRMIQTLLRGENDSKQADEIQAKDYAECQISRSYQYLIKAQAAQAECKIHLVSYCIILKKPRIICIDTSSNQLLGSALENVRLPQTDRC